MFSAYCDNSATVQCEDKTFSAELLPCCLSVTLGKVGQVDGLYLVRQVHDRRYILSEWFQWLKSDNWQPSYTCFREQLGRVITDLDSLNLADALNIVDNAFSAYLKRNISGHPNNNESRIRPVLERIPFAVRVLRQLKSLAPATTNSHNVSFAGLKCQSSRYSDDFQAVLDAIFRMYAEEG